jgi:hypothetical protein
LEREQGVEFDGGLVPPERGPYGNNERQRSMVVESSA